MKKTILELCKVLDEDVAAALAKAAKNLVDAMIKEGFTKSEAIEIMTHIQGK